MSKRLADLNPRWVTTGDRDRVGITFDCPCCPACYADAKAERWSDGDIFNAEIPYRICVPFANPPDGGSPAWGDGWQRSGESFADMTLAPSVDTSNQGHWHGWVKGGVCE